MTRARKRLAAALPAALALWIAIDLHLPLSRDLRTFDARAVARLETEMWKSYYAHERLRLVGQLSELMQRQYGMPFWRARLAAFHAARAAVVFQRGRARADYRQALPHLNAFYRLVAGSSAQQFDVSLVAALELEWWIVHRERATRGAPALEAALAALQAALYRQPPDAFTSHARARAEAMLLRDRQAAAGGVSDAGWQHIETLLLHSWTALHASVQQPGNGPRNPS